MGSLFYCPRLYKNTSLCKASLHYNGFYHLIVSEVEMFDLYKTLVLGLELGVLFSGDIPEALYWFSSFQAIPVNASVFSLNSMETCQVMFSNIAAVLPRGALQAVRPE